MRESAEDLRPDDAEVADIAAAELGEDAVEDVAEHVHAKAGDDGFAAAGAGVSVSKTQCLLLMARACLLAIGDPAEGE
jgi:hypothetical protein